MDDFIQIILKTNNDKYSVPSTPISIPNKFASADLDKLVKELLEGNVPEDIEFDFIIEKKFLLTTISEFLIENKLSSETLTVNYTVKQRPPKLTNEIELDDLVSCIRRKDKYILISCYDGTVQLWSVNADEPVFSVPLEIQVKCIEWTSFDTDSNLATFASGSFDQAIRLWEWNYKKDVLDCKYVLRGHKNTVTCLKSNEEILISGSQDASVKIWSLNDEKKMENHSKKSSCDKIPTLVPDITLTGHREMLTGIDLVKDEKNKIVTVSWDHSIRVWDFNATQGEETRCIMTSHALHSLNVSNFDGRVLTGSSDTKIRIYDLRCKDEALSQIGFKQHNSWVTSVSWSPTKEEQFISGCVDGSVRLWDTRNSQAPLYQLMAHNEMVTTVDWAPPITDPTHDNPKSNVSKHFILSGSADSTIKIFSVEQL